MSRLKREPDYHRLHGLRVYLKPERLRTGAERDVVCVCVCGGIVYMSKQRFTTVASA